MGRSVPQPDMRVDARRLHGQMAAIFAAWGMSRPHADTIADLLVAADLMGIDSHGATLLALYEEHVASGKAATRPQPRVERSRGAVAVIDGDGAFGQIPGVMAVEIADEKARAFGIGAVGVRNSNHYGAAGVYVRRLGEAGLIGISTSSVWRPAMAPTGGRAPMLGTNPIAFAAPCAGGPPFLLDMATSAAAIGKIKLRLRAGEPLPEGWALDADGAPQLDPAAAMASLLLAPLGGDPIGGGHKGYGLATMVEVLSAVLPGATAAALRGAGGARHDVGQFFLAMDPAFFLDDPAGFAGHVARLTDALRATPRSDAGVAVMVAGDREYAREAERRARGIPIPAPLADQIRDIAARAGAAFSLDGEAATA